MAILRYKDIKSLSKEEKKAKLEELKKELVKQNVQRSTGTPMKSSGKVKEMRKTIARILTHDNQKEVGMTNPKGKEKKNEEE